MTSRRYTSPKRAAAAAKTRQRLVRAAAKHLRSPEGLQALSLESVARSAGVSRLTVYNQFGSRRGLLEAVFDDRAHRGGMHLIGEAMANPDPHAGLARLIAIFCACWDFDRETVARLHGAAVADPELDASLRARNERRRKSLAVLVGRLEALHEVRPQASGDLIDVLFTLTSFSVFAELARRGRDADAVRRLIQDLAEAALKRAVPRR